MIFTFFYGQQVYDQTDDWDAMMRTMNNGPEGLYMHDSRHGVWYLKGNGIVEDDDVPAYIRFLQLVLPN